MKIVRFVLLGLAAVVLVPVAYLALMGGMDLSSYVPLASAALLGVAVSALALPFIAAMAPPRVVIGATIVTELLAALAVVLAPAWSRSKAGADRGAVIVFVLVPVMIGTAFALAAALLPRKRAEPTAGATTP